MPEDPVCLPARRPRTTLAREAIAAVRRVAWEEKLARVQARKTYSSKEVPVGAGSYAGFASKESVRPPPIAQPPNAAELIELESDRLANFVHNEATQAHLEQGGSIFAAQDYLDVAPLTGPADGGDWGALEARAPDAARDADGHLVSRPGQRDVHAMPIELLMGQDLANERGLKWRMRRHQLAKAEREAAAAEREKESEELLKELDVLRI